MRQRLAALRHELGFSGALGLALLGFFVVFSILVLNPLEARHARLQEQLARMAPGKAPDTGAEKVAAVYGFLKKPESATDWLAKLHGIGAASGVKLRSASYKTQPAEGAIVRYEIVLPVSGSYPQIRDFLQRSLAEIPVLSLDQLALKREDGGAVQAELRLTLHMVKS
jgi:hypothetical protein